jgi:hypothetical protein
VLEDGLKEIRRAILKGTDVQKDSNFETTNKSGVRMVWRELGQTVALHLGYDETKVEEKDVPVIRAGPREKMGPRFSELYKRHFVTSNVENPASCAGDDIGENNIPSDEGVESDVNISFMSEKESASAAASVVSTSATSEGDDIVELLTDMDDSSTPGPAIDTKALRAALSQAQAKSRRRRRRSRRRRRRRRCRRRQGAAGADQDASGNSTSVPLSPRRRCYKV